METNNFYDMMYNDDCLKVMPTLPNECCDVIICDLPYGTTCSRWDTVLPLGKLWEQYKRLLKHQGSVVLFGSEPFSSTLRMSNLKWYKYDWIWHKPTTTGFQHAKNMPLKDYETISVFSAASMGHISLLGDNRMIYNPQGVEKVNEVKKESSTKFGNIVDKRPSHKQFVVVEGKNYPRMTLEFAKDNSNYHPTQKPIELLRYLIRTYTNIGGVVLDNTMGSGSTCVAAALEKRHFIGIEKEKKYYDIAVKRVLDAKREMNTLFNNDF